MKNGLNYLFNLSKRFVFAFILIFVIFSNFSMALAVDPAIGSVNVGGSVQYVPTKLVFLSAPQIVERGEYSNEFTIQIQNEAGYPVSLISDAEVYLASTSVTGEFFQSVGGTQISQVTINAGSSSANFYYRDITAGNFNISISHSGWTSTSQPIVIQDTTPPNPPVVLTPVDQQIFTSATNPVFSGTSDLDTTVLVTINGITYSTITDPSGDWSLTWPIELGNGSYSSSTIARDVYGNDSLAVIVNFSVIIPEPTPTPTVTPTLTPTPTISLTLTPTPTPAPTPTPLPSGPLLVNIIIDNMTNKYDNTEIDIKKNVLVNTDMTLVTQPSLDKPVSSVIGYLGGIKYEFVDANGDGIYEKQLTTPLISGQYKLKIVVTYDDGQVEEFDMTVLVDPFGYVYEVLYDTQLKIRGAVVVLWVYKDGKWQIWKAEPYNQINPQLTVEDGEYGFIVPEGLYYLTAEKDGYEFYKSHTMYVTEGNPVNINIMMTKMNIAGIIGDIVQWFKDVAASINIFVAPFVYNDFAQDTYVPINIATAIAVILTTLLMQVGNMSLMSPFANIFARIGTFFGAIPRRKKSWGIVYDSENYKPIAMAVVQLFDREFGKLMETQVTDKDGRFGFLVRPGEYFVKVNKQNYTFPSKLQKHDYHGDIIKVTDKAVLTINVPIDPDIRSLAKRILSINKVYRVVNVLRLALLIAGTWYTFSFAVIEYNVFNISLFILYVIAWINEIYLLTTSAKAFSKVYDTKNNEGVGLGIVRVFDKKGKIISTKVSDNTGNFAFLVGQGDYYLTITRPDYEQFKSDELHFNKHDLIKKKFGLKPNNINISDN